MERDLLQPPLSHRLVPLPLEQLPDLPPLPLSISNATEPAQGLVITAREVTAHGTTH